MKKQLFFIGLFCALASPLSAQNTSEKPSLVGIWQHCMPMADPFIKDTQTGKFGLDTTLLIGGLTFKILMPNGDFSNLFINPEYSQINSYVNAYGTYDVVSDNVFVEHITQSYSNPVYNGKDNPLSYHFFGNNYCVFGYTAPNGGKAQEFWRRVPGGIPATSKAPQPQQKTKEPAPAKEKKDEKKKLLDLAEVN